MACIHLLACPASKSIARCAKFWLLRTRGRSPPYPARGCADAPSDGRSSKFCALAPRGSATMDEGRFSVSAQFRVAPLFCRPWTLNGISPRLIESHYEHNYGAALTRLNAVTRELEGIDFGIAAPQAIGRLKREQ